jgi:hypothetical protein
MMQGKTCLVSPASVAVEAVTKSDRSAAFRCTIETAETTFFMIKFLQVRSHYSHHTLLNALTMAVSMSLQTVPVVI